MTIADGSFTAPLELQNLRADVQSGLMVIRCESPLTARIRPVNPEAPRWLEPIADRFVEIATLQDDWNGEGAPAPGRDLLISALRGLATFMPEFAVVPSVVATAEGGIQFEWHAGGWDVEVEFDPSGEVSVWGRDRNSGEAISGELPAARERLILAIKMLTSNTL